MLGIGCTALQVSFTCNQQNTDHRKWICTVSLLISAFKFRYFSIKTRVVSAWRQQQIVFTPDIGNQSIKVRQTMHAERTNCEQYELKHTFTYMYQMIMTNQPTVCGETVNGSFFWHIIDISIFRFKENVVKQNTPVF